MLLQELREKVVEVGMILYDFRLVGISDGNISARDPETNLVAVKPSGFSYPKIRPEDVVIVDVNGRVVEGRQKPSSETPMHTCVYRRRAEINGAIHCHAPYATAWSVAGKSIPPVITSQVVTGAGSIPISPYQQPGTLELGECALEDMGKGFAVILQNHGPLCVGYDLDHALSITLVVEEAAKTALFATRIGGELRLMTQQDYSDMLKSHRRG